MSRPPPPCTPQNPTPAPRPGGPSPSSILPASFSNLQISRAPPPFASVGLPQGDGPVASSIRGPQAPPPGTRPFPGTPSPPGSLFARTAPSVQQSPPFGAPLAAQSLQPQRPPFNGPPPVLPAQVQRAPFGDPPAASQPLPFGGPPAAVSQPAPFGVSPVATAQSAPLGAPPYSAAQPPPFSGLSGAVSRPAYSGGSIPPFGAARGPSQQGAYGGPPQFGGERPGLQTPLFGAQTAPASQPPPFMGVPGANAPAFRPPGWQGQTRPNYGLEADKKLTIPVGTVRMPGMPGAMPPNALGQGMPSTPTMPYSPHAGAQVSTPSKIDPNQIPRPITETSVVIFETRQAGQAAVPPAASSEFIVKDTGNCSPRLMRCTMNQVRFDQYSVFFFGRFSNDTPREYLCNLGPDGRRRDADDRPELCRGTVEFIATKEFLVREPMPAVYFFLVDVSMNAIQTGATAAACSAISQSLSDLPDPTRGSVYYKVIKLTYKELVKEDEDRRKHRRYIAGSSCWFSTAQAHVLVALGGLAALPWVNVAVICSEIPSGLSVPDMQQGHLHLEICGGTRGDHGGLGCNKTKCSPGFGISSSNSIRRSPLPSTEMPKHIPFEYSLASWGSSKHPSQKDSNAPELYKQEVVADWNKVSTPTPEKFPGQTCK
ncbi:unnamed protein product [Triticum turgidum subsp. durum]|uniref:Sec23/Sec24 trunk domain-containing protein n=1 Tax=Triticum turgidum subsp. durum TaxID=4567 RepID=A0A9R0TIZ9_TRITD|nr:unnamed protein product [Triticum turgidum subsp. durum]